MNINLLFFTYKNNAGISAKSLRLVSRTSANFSPWLNSGGLAANKLLEKHAELYPDMYYLLDMMICLA